MNLISIIIPTWNRPEQLLRCLCSISDTTPGGAYEVLVDDEYHESPVVKWNRTAAKAKGDWLLLGADDQIFRPGWHKAAREHSAGGFVGLNDGSPHPNSEGFVPHYLVSRQFCIDFMGGCLAIPFYVCWWFDREVCERAQRAGLYTFVEGALVEHMHPDWKKAEMDNTYRVMKTYHDFDRTIYEWRKECGYPDDFEPVLPSLPPGVSI